MKKRGICLLIVLVLAGCSYKPKIKPSGLELPASEAKAACLAIAEANPITSFRALVKTSFHSKEGIQSARYAVLYQMPSSVRIELLPTSGFYALGVLAGSNQSGFTYLDVVNKESIFDQSFGGLSEIIFQGLRFSLEDLVAGMAGHLPQEVCDDAVTIRTNDDLGKVFIESKRQERLWVFDKSLNRISALVITDPFSDNHQLEFIVDLTKTNNPIELFAPLLDISAEMNFIKYEKNISIASKLFTVEIPGDYQQLKK